MAHKMTDEKSQSSIKKSFEVFDADRSGKIDVNELRRIMCCGERLAVAGRVAHQVGRHRRCVARDARAIRRAIPATPPRRALLRRNFRRLTTASASRPGNGAIDYDEFTKILLAERTTRFAPVSGGGGFLGVSPA